MKMCCHINLYRPARWIGFITNDLCIYDMHLFLYLLLHLAVFLCGHVIQNSKRIEEAVRETQTNGAERETERGRDRPRDSDLQE